MKTEPGHGLVTLLNDEAVARKRSRNHGLVHPGKPGTDPLLDGIVDVDGGCLDAWVLQ